MILIKGIRVFLLADRSWFPNALSVCARMLCAYLESRYIGSFEVVRLRIMPFSS